jgi:hypothetical protein
VLDRPTDAIQSQRRQPALEGADHPGGDGPGEPTVHSRLDTPPALVSRRLQYAVHLEPAEVEEVGLTAREIRIDQDRQIGVFAPQAL